jgi:hypothetical protein
MMLVIGAVLVGARCSGAHWIWRGIPMIDIGYIFVALGAILALYGIAKKA